MDKMEIFQKNMEKAGFTTDFISLALHYFIEIRREGEVQEIDDLLDVIHYYSQTGSFTYNSLQSFYNLHNFREDLYKLYRYDTSNIIDFSNYFENIENFELQVVYALYSVFYPVRKK